MPLRKTLLKHKTAYGLRNNFCILNSLYLFQSYKFIIVQRHKMSLTSFFVNVFLNISVITKYEEHFVGNTQRQNLIS